MFMRTRINQNKEQIFCDWRKRWVRLTPEEWVRQNFLHLLVEEYGYPASLIAVEMPIKVGEVQKRCDAVVFNRLMTPVVLIEFKADTVPLTQKTLDQAVVYNRKLNVPFLILHNGPQTICINIQPSTITPLEHIPEWKQLSR